jgi:5-(carboxyamino)imidazole ribonucleotide synthase
VNYFQPDKIKIGVLGGGQLGRMIIQSAINYNLYICCLDPDANAPCKAIANEFTKGSLTDYDTVYKFGKDKDIITIEIENVNVEALKDLQKLGKKVFPQPEVIEIIKDKGLQKMFYQRNDIPSPDFFLVENKAQIEKYKDFFPFFQKMRTGGYDGKGVVKLGHPNKIEHAFEVPSVLERLVDFDKEISVIVARNESGETKCFPAVECEFNPEANLVEFLFSPANIKKSIDKQATEIAIKIAEKLNIVGILAVEFFLTKEGELLVNEIAPRPHNSGHHTIEACFVSQYGMHLRAILNMPLGSAGLRTPAVMINLLGEKGFEGKARYENIEDVLHTEGAYIHLYGKEDTKPFRKMGHITVCNANLEEAKDTARKFLAEVKVKA